MKLSFVIRLSLLASALLSATACSTVGFGSSGVGTPIVPAPSGTDIVTTGSDPEEVINRAYQNLKTVRSYRSHQEITNVKGVTTKGEVEHVAPDRSHTVLQSEKGPFEMITIGKDSYVEVNGKWTRSQTGERDVNDLPGSPELDKINSELKTTVQYEVVGPDMIDATPVIEFQAETTKTGPYQLTSTTRLWLGTRDNLIYRIENETVSELSGKTYRNGAVSTYRDYNTEIRIEPPM